MSRRILITGTTRGLGRFIAEHYLACGDTVIGCGRGEPSIDHPGYAHLRADITQDGDIRQLVSDVKRIHGGLDVLINNAGTASMNAFALTPPDSMRRVVDTNFIGAMLLTHGAIRLLRASTCARIVNITTIAVPLRLAGEAVYAASKAGIETFTRILAREVGAMGITCNAVGPSLIRTRLTEGVPAAKRERLLAEQAIPREATPADVVSVIDFFLSPASGMVTGQILYLGGIG